MYNKLKNYSLSFIILDISIGFTNEFSYDFNLFKIMFISLLLTSTLIWTI